MHKIRKAIRIDYYLQLTFEDNSVRAIDLAPHLKVDPSTVLNEKPNIAKVRVRPDKHAIIWNHGAEIPSDFLYENSLLIGWMETSHTWRPISFSKAEIKVEVSDGQAHSCLLLDGKCYPALRIASASFGIHENTAWYHVPFPGDVGVYEPELVESPIVIKTLKQLVALVNKALEGKKGIIINITEQLQRTGQGLSVESISPRNAAIVANRFKERRPLNIGSPEKSGAGRRQRHRR